MSETKNCLDLILFCSKIDCSWIFCAFRRSTSILLFQLHTSLRSLLKFRFSFSAFWKVELCDSECWGKNGVGCDCWVDSKVFSCRVLSWGASDLRTTTSFSSTLEAETTSRSVFFKVYRILLATVRCEFNLSISSVTISFILLDPKVVGNCLASSIMFISF